MAIVDCAVAADGGSLAIALADAAGSTTWFSINRSIAARDTEHWNVVSRSDGPLHTREVEELRQMLSTIVASGDAHPTCESIVREFVQYLSETPEGRC